MARRLVSLGRGRVAAMTVWRAFGLSLLLALALGLGLGSAAAASCDPSRVDLRGDWGQAAFNVSVADDPQERSRGLMFVEEMARSTGMLFVYEAPQVASFWMRNTLIPLDMIFAGPDGVVRHVHSNAIPGDETPILGGDDILVVLEINGGLAEQFGIDPGTELRHPALGDAAAWPCN
ncbi:MAG: DUF192 domain-containing protein [Pseudomonadota bacterium]